MYWLKPAKLKKIAGWSLYNNPPFDRFRTDQIRVMVVKDEVKPWNL